MLDLTVGYVGSAASSVCPSAASRRSSTSSPTPAGRAGVRRSGGGLAGRLLGAAGPASRAGHGPGGGRGEILAAEAALRVGRLTGSSATARSATPSSTTGTCYAKRAWAPPRPGARRPTTGTPSPWPWTCPASDPLPRTDRPDDRATGNQNGEIVTASQRGGRGCHLPRPRPGRRGDDEPAAVPQRAELGHDLRAGRRVLPGRGRRRGEGDRARRRGEALLRRARHRHPRPGRRHLVRPRRAGLWWDHVGKPGADSRYARESEVYLGMCRRWREICPSRRSPWCRAPASPAG